MRLAGLVCVFDQPVLSGKVPLIPVVCSMKELLTGSTLDYLILDLHESGSSLHPIHAILRVRPGIRLLVIGPQGNDDLALEVISAGARAYLDRNSEIAVVRLAIDVVISGHICAPRRVLSKLIDRLLNVSDSSLTDAPPQLTSREKQVIELILTARSNREIARDLGIASRTVSSHVGRLMRKTNTGNRIELALFIRKHYRALTSPDRERPTECYPLARTPGNSISHSTTLPAQGREFSLLALRDS
jgi:DNA-binding NarL/FixJ family response regulator